MIDSTRPPGVNGILETALYVESAARSDLFSKGYTNPFFWAPFVLTGE